MYIHYLLFFGFPSHLGYHRALNKFPGLFSKLSLVIYSVTKMNEIVPFAETWMDLRDFHVEWNKSEIEKWISYINTYIWILEKWYRWTHLKSRNIWSFFVEHVINLLFLDYCSRRGIGFGIQIIRKEFRTWTSGFLPSRLQIYIRESLRACWYWFPWIKYRE